MLKRVEKFITLENILVLAVLVAAFFIRVFRVNEILGFYYDQGRDGLVIWDLIHKGKLFLIGPTTGIAGIFRGPFYYYLIAPFYWLGCGNPVWPDVFLAFTSVVALGLMYFLTKKIGGVTAGAIALVLGGFSVGIVGISRWLSNPTPMLLLSMILIWMMFLVQEGKKWAWMIIAFILGLSLFNFGSSGEVFYFLGVAILALWQFFFTKKGTKNIPSLKTVLISIGLFIFTVLPLVLFDFKHGGILGGNIKGFLVTGNSFSFPTWKFVSDRLVLMAGYLSSLILPNIYEKGTLILVALGVSVVYCLSRLLKNNYFKIIFIMVISPVIGLTFFQGNYGNLYSYYLTGYYLIFLLLISATLAYIFRTSWTGKILVAFFLFLFFSQNYPLIRGLLLTTGNENTTIVLANEEKAIDWIYKDAGGRDFNVDEYVPPVIPYSYNYLFLWLGTEKYHKLPDESQVPLLYTLYEVDPPHPERLQAWLDRQKGIGRIIKEEKFGGITIQERERLARK